MALFKRLAVIAGAAEAARRFAKSNPDKVQRYTEQAARFADQRTHGKYSQQIDSARRKVDQFTHGRGHGPSHGPDHGPSHGGWDQPPGYRS